MKLIYLSPQFAFRKYLDVDKTGNFFVAENRKFLRDIDK